MRLVSIVWKDSHYIKLEKVSVEVWSAGWLVEENEKVYWLASIMTDKRPGATGMTRWCGRNHPIEKSKVIRIVDLEISK